MKSKSKTKSSAHRELKPRKDKTLKIFTFGGKGAKVINIPKYETDKRLKWAVGDQLEYHVTESGELVLRKRRDNGV